MLQNLFISVVNMSITASYVAIGVILVRLLLQKAPKIFSYILWIPVLFRLVCPISFASTFSFFNLLSLNVKQESGVVEFVPQNIGLMQAPAIQSGLGSIDSAVNPSLPVATPLASVNPMQIWLAVFSLIWFMGVIALLVYSIVSYAKIKGKLQTATRVAGNVFETDAIDTAFVCGFFGPKIYVPANMGDANLSYILEHERTHIRRKDYLIKPLAFLALILHWFNPLMWLCFALMSRDMEMSCDESVLRKLGDGARGGYSSSLLSLAVKNNRFLTANPLAFGENHVKARIKNVLNFNKPAFWVIVVAVVAVCAVTIAFITNPFNNAADTSVDTSFLYRSEDYQISLCYPSSWKVNPNYIERYEGKDGFFQVGAIDGKEMSIDEAAQDEALHKLNPYGSAPQIIKCTIGQEEARLILPSADQAEEMHHQAGLIVKYPEAVQIGGSAYYYFILWADEAHIEQIGNTITFLKKQTGDEKGSDRIASLIKENLAVIMSSPRTSSNPQDYINAHQAEYNAILALETQALPYLFAEFEKGGQTGIKGYIMQNLCWDILGEDNIQYTSKDPQDWYDTFKKHVQRIAASSSVDFVKANSPKHGALLDVIITPGTEGIAQLVEENLAIILSSPKEASSPFAYIQAHQDEYEKIKKLGGEEALQYMLSQLANGNA
jgi:beta-lactamase regulating signal transducer with metallopeptidase domain